MGWLRSFERKVLRPIGNVIKKAVHWSLGIPDYDMEDRIEGALLNKQSNIASIPIIYGQRKVGGTRVFVATSGTNNTYLYIVLVLCEGEVSAIGDVYINDKISTDPQFSGLVTITKYVGTDSQTADPTLVAAGVGWTSSHRLRGLAYLAMRFTYNQDAFAGIPDVTCVVDGKKCYDPRTATTIYTTNPAVCLRDYLANPLYGKGLASASINDTSFIAAANKCDEAVAKYSGAAGTEPIFDFNGIISTGDTLFNNVKIFLSSMRGIFPFSDGKYSLVIEDDYSSSFDFDIDNIMSDIKVSTVPKNRQYNRVVAKFTNPNANWQADSITWPDPASTDYSDFLSEDDDVELVGEITLPATTDIYAARDLARIVCLDSRQAKLYVAFVSTAEAISCSVGDVVTLTHESFGWTNKLFRVTDMGLSDTGDVTIGLKEHSATIYPWVEEDQISATSESDLPNPFFVEAPTAFVITEDSSVGNDGTVISTILVRWTAAQDAFVEIYEFQYRLSGTTDYLSIDSREPFVAAQGTVVGTAYDIRVRAVNSLGVRSEWLTSTYTILGDTTGPEKPTGFSITGSITEARVSWDACIAADYKETIVYGSLTNDFGSATEQARISGTVVVYYDLPESTTFYGWIRHFDFSGNAGTLSDVEIFDTSRGVISPPTSLSVSLSNFISATGDGTAIPIVRVSWTAPAQEVQYYELEYKETSLSNWQSISVPTTFYEANNPKEGVSYDVRVRAVNENFGKSTYLTGTFTPAKDTTAPATPAGLTIVGDYNQAVLSWNAATEKDYKHTLIYASTTNNSATATLEATISGNTVTVAGLPVSTTYYVWLKNEDFSGNVSGFSGMTSFNTTTGAAASSVVAGGTIAGTVTTDAVQMSTIRTNAASGKSISDTLLVSGTATLKGIIQPDNTGAIRTGSITWNSTTGALSGGTGIAMTEWGIIGAAGGVATFSIEATTGNAIFKGSITGATGTFSGDLNTSGQVKGTGSTSAGAPLGNASVVGAPTSSTVKGVVGISTNTVGVQGFSTNSIGVYASSDSSTDSALYVDQLGTYAYAARFVGNTITTGNVVIGGAATNTGTRNLVIGEGSAGTRIDNQILIYGALSSTSDTTVGVVTEQDVVASASTTDVRVRVWWNGVEYWLPLQTI